MLTSKLNNELRTELIGHGNKAHRRILIQEVLYLIGSLQLETLHIVILLLAIVVAYRIYTIGTISLHTYRVVREVLLKVITRDVVLILLRPHHNLIVTLELAEKLASTIHIQATHILIIPYVLATQRRGTPLLEHYLVYRVARNEVTHTLTSLDSQGREVEVEDALLKTGARTQIYLEHLGLTIRINRKVEKLAPRRALRQVILLIARDRLDSTSLHHYSATTTITVEHVIYRALVVTLIYTYVVYTLIEEGLLRNLRNLITAILKDDNHIVEVRAVTDKLRLLHALTKAEEALGTINIELGI